MSRSIVIAGFPGVGKTSAATRVGWIDVESCPFHWVFDPEDPNEPMKEKQNWVDHYVNYIEKLIKEDNHSVIMVSTHNKVREAMHNRGIKFVVVAPISKLKNEYMVRYLRRGSDCDFLYHMDKHFEEYVRDLIYESAPVIWLESPNQVIKDVLPG